MRQRLALPGASRCAFCFFSGYCLLFLCTGAAGICPCRALSPHLHGMRFCTRCGIVTLGECPKTEHSFTYSLHHISAFWVGSSKYWDFPQDWPAFVPGLFLRPGPCAGRSPKPGMAGAWPCPYPGMPRPGRFLRFLYLPLPNLYPVFTPRSVTCRCPDWSPRLPGAHPLCRAGRRSKGASLPGGKTWMPSISPFSPPWPG